MGTCASAEASPTVSPLPVKPSGNQPSRKLGSIGGSGSNGSRSASIDMAVEAGGGAVSRRLLSAMGVVASELDPLRAQERIVTEAISILGCDRATIFRVDALRKELTLHLAEQDLDIRVPFGKGIAGWVAQQGEVANIADAYTDGRFEKQADMDSGYKTTSVLCAPIRSPAGDTVAVLQAINKTRGPCFTAEDQAVLEQLSVLAGISLRNAKLYQDALRQQQKTSALVEVVRCLSADMGVQSLILTITTRAPALVGAAACTLYLVDHRQNQLWSVATDSGKEFRIPRNAGIAGHVATSGEVVNIPDCYSDDRFNQDSDKKSGFTTRSMLVAPLSKQVLLLLLACTAVVSLLAHADVSAPVPHSFSFARRGMAAARRKL